MDLDDLPLTGTCDLSTMGRRSGRWRRVEIWYVIIDGQLVGRRHVCLPISDSRSASHRPASRRVVKDFPRWLPSGPVYRA